MTRDGKENIPCYIAKAPCGCIVSAMVDDPAEREKMAKEIKKFMRESINDGLTVERSTVGFIRANFGHKCGLELKAPKQKRLALTEPQA